MTTTRQRYEEYLRSPHWLELRDRIIGARPWCNRCGISRCFAKLVYRQDLNLHHKNYLRIGRELDSDLEVLCRSCHETESIGFSMQTVVGRTCKWCGKKFFWMVRGANIWEGTGAASPTICSDCQESTPGYDSRGYEQEEA